MNRRLLYILATINILLSIYFQYLVTVKIAHLNEKINSIEFIVEIVKYQKMDISSTVTQKEKKLSGNRKLTPIDSNKINSQRSMIKHATKIDSTKTPNKSTISISNPSKNDNLSKRPTSFAKRLFFSKSSSSYNFNLNLPETQDFEKSPLNFVYFFVNDSGYDIKIGKPIYYPEENFFLIKFPFGKIIRSGETVYITIKTVKKDYPETDPVQYIIIPTVYSDGVRGNDLEFKIYK